MNNNTPGQNPTVIKAVHRIFELTNNRGVHTAARGFDAGVMFDDRLDNEDAIRFLKSRICLGNIRTFRWCAIRRLALLSVLVVNCLVWVVEALPGPGERLVAFGQPRQMVPTLSFIAC